MAHSSFESPWKTDMYSIYPWFPGFQKKIRKIGNVDTVQQPLFYDFTWDSGDFDCLDCFKCKYFIHSSMIRKIFLSTCGYMHGTKPDSLMNAHQNSWTPVSFVLGHELVWRTAVSALNRSLLGAFGAKSSFVLIISGGSLTNLVICVENWYFGMTVNPLEYGCSQLPGFRSLILQIFLANPGNQG